MRNFKVKEFALIFPLLLSSIARATDISGQISDPAGGSIAGARVRAMQADRTIAETTTDAVGHYVLTVPAGTYVILASAPKLRTANRALQVPSEGSITSDFVLSLPAIEQTVTVTGERDFTPVTSAAGASKTDTPILDLPRSVEVVPSAVLEDRQVTSIYQALENVSGVSKEGTFTTHSSSADSITAPTAIETS